MLRTKSGLSTGTQGCMKISNKCEVRFFFHKTKTQIHTHIRHQRFKPEKPENVFPSLLKGNIFSKDVLGIRPWSGGLWVRDTGWGSACLSWAGGGLSNGSRAELGHEMIMEPAMLALWQSRELLLSHEGGTWNTYHNSCLHLTESITEAFWTNDTKNNVWEGSGVQSICLWVLYWRVQGGRTFPIQFYPLLPMAENYLPFI